MQRWLYALLVAAFVLIGCGPGSSESSSSTSGSAENGKSSGAKRTIAFIPKGATHEFWKTMQAGAEKAAAETGVELKWKAPIKEDDRTEQINVVETFTSKKVDGIVLCPLDENALVAPVQEAINNKIPVLIVDSGIQKIQPVSSIMTDNFAAGKTSAKELAKALNGKKRVIMLRYLEGSASTTARESGFLEGAKESGLEVLSSELHGGATRESAQNASENMLARYKSGSGYGVDGIFTPNESTTFGMMRALQGIGQLGKITLVGFDSSVELVQAVRDGTIHGLLLQDPFKMGYLGVTKMAQYLDGKKPEAKIDSGAVFVTKATIDSPEAKAVLPK